jgi:acetolactate synthase small subunit
MLSTGPSAGHTALRTHYPREHWFVFEITGASDQLDAFIHLMEPLGLTEVSRAGVVAIARGAKGL